MEKVRIIVTRLANHGYLNQGLSQEFNHSQLEVKLAVNYW